MQKLKPYVFGRERGSYNFLGTVNVKNYVKKCIKRDIKRKRNDCGKHKKREKLRAQTHIYESTIKVKSHTFKAVNVCVDSYFIKTSLLMHFTQRPPSKTE